MRENCTSGTARGALGNRRSYRGGHPTIRCDRNGELTNGQKPAELMMRAKELPAMGCCSTLRCAREGTA